MELEDRFALIRKASSHLEEARRSFIGFHQLIRRVVTLQALPLTSKSNAEVE